MEGYQYSHGDTPLEGYVIQRAVGRGGFGEVYYAISDAGREVALKVIHGYENIEVRGVSQCMNLKSPHLVSIFDIKRNAQGKSFVVMEYVNGPSLKDLLDQCPAGLGVQKSAFFLRELAKGLSFLHERGIVHRDLKPGNIFYEDGYVKIGDYGLSKAMGVSRHSGQTITVGTVQYMAPEVGMGKYDRSIDIYALGVCLFEMLTGQVPFFGSSHGEILMKHLMAQPDLAGVEEPFATVIRKAMSKDPADRYQSVQEMVEAVFGAEHVRNSVSCFSPDSLTMVAGRVAEKVGTGAAGPERAGGGAAVGTGSSAANDGGYGTYRPPLGDDSSDVWGRVAQRVDEARGRVQQRVEEVGGRLRQHYEERRGRPWIGPREGPPPIAAETSRDPLNRRQRITLAVLAAAAVSIGVGVFGDGSVSGHMVYGGENGAAAALLVSLMSASLMLAHRKLARRVPIDDGIARRIVYGGAASVAILVSSPFLIEISYGLRNSIPPMLIAAFLIEWSGRLDAGRPQRVNLGQAFTAGLAGWVLALMMNGAEMTTGGIFAGVSLTLQALAAFDPLAARAAREQSAVGTPGAPGRLSSAPPLRPQRNADVASPGARQTPPMSAQSYREEECGPISAASGELRMIPGWLRVLFTVIFGVLGGTGVFLFALMMFARMSSDDEQAAVAGGTACLALGAFFAIRAANPAFRGYWCGVFRPLLMLVFGGSIIGSGIILMSQHLSNDETALALGFLIFPAVFLLIVAALSGKRMPMSAARPKRNTDAPVSPDAASDRDAFVALLLACGGFMGVGGLHRFYCGKHVTGILWLVTFGGFMIGTIVDVVLIAMGLFKDRRGLPLRVWMGIERIRPYSTEPMPLSKWPAASRHGSAEPDRVAMAPGAFDTAPMATPMPTRRPEKPRQIYEPALTNPWLSAVGVLLLIIAFALGVAVAVDLPTMVAAGFPDPSIATDFTRLFGYSDWPRLVNRMSRVLAATLGLASAMTLLIARRRTGAAHTGRVAFAAIGLFTTVMLLAGACSDIRWFTIVPLFNGNQPGPGLEALLDRVNMRQALMAGALLLGSAFVLMWPERRVRLDALEAKTEASQ